MPPKRRTRNSTSTNTTNNNNINNNNNNNRGKKLTPTSSKSNSPSISPIRRKRRSTNKSEIENDKASSPPNNNHNNNNSKIKIESNDNDTLSRRPKRASSLNVDYNLKKRKIITSDENSTSSNNNDKKIKSTNNSSSSPNTSSSSTSVSSTTSNNDISQINEVKLIERDSKGRIIKFNDISLLNPNDVKNAATGVSLNKGPSEKIKYKNIFDIKDSLWNNKKIIIPDNNHTLELRFYKNNLKTNDSDKLTKQSNIRHDIIPIDIHKNERINSYNNNNNKNKNKSNNIIRINLKNKSIVTSNHPHTKTKNKKLIAKEQNSKLFGRNTLSIDDEDEQESLTNKIKKEQHDEQPEEEKENDLGFENDDFCSSCNQTGSFLCCDTCPKSFHFLCLNPPLDPENLPKGNWSCNNCKFKQKYPNKIQSKKGENDFIQSLPIKNKLFGKLLFRTKSVNPKQFELPSMIKSTFKGVKTGTRGQYQDNSFKDMPTEKQLFGTPYGQSITQLDTYTPDSHIDQENGHFLICYKCKTTRMGTWDNYQNDSSILMKCDYCKTPWHLDCIPRASLKNLGSKWKCPLHAFNKNLPNSKLKQKRHLTKHQKKINVLQSCGFKNNGDIEILLDEIISENPKETGNTTASNTYNPIPIINENSIKLDFFDKIFKAKNVQTINTFNRQNNLIEKLVKEQNNQKNSKLNDINSLLYFSISNTPNLKKMWDFKELCILSDDELKSENNEKNSTENNEILSSNELMQLKQLKTLLESKNKNEIIDFFNLKNP